MSTIDVRLPDGKTLVVPHGATVLAVAEEIGPGLAKAALAGRIEGQLVDLRVALESDVELEIVTSRDPAGGEVIRHSAEHVMADAVKRLFPDAQVDAGRVDHTEKFQYDFLVEEPFTPADVERIQAEVQKILAEKAPFERLVVSREDARQRFRELGEELKLRRLDDIPEGEEITLFEHGPFVDLCRGPHVQRTDQIGAVALLETSGTYFRGDEKGPKLQRIYGTAFANKKELKAHLARIEDAKKRDHRRVGAALELFYLDPLSPGSPFYLPNGMALYNGLINYVRSLYPRYGLQEVMTPQISRADEVLKEGWFYTGDAGYLDDDGHLLIIGRKQDIMRTREGEAFSPDFIETRLKFSPYIKEAVIWGEGELYLTAFINIDFGNVGNWAEDRKIPYTTYTDLSQQPTVEEMIRGEVREVNTQLPKPMQLAKIIILYKLLDADDEELTRTGKVRRKFVFEQYKDLIDAMYADKTELAVKGQVLYRDGHVGTIETTVRILDV